MCRGDHLDQVVIEKFGQSSNAMADHVVQQLTGQLAHPVVPVGKDRSQVTGVAEVVGPMTLQVQWTPTEKPLLDKPSHLEHLRRELVIVACGHQTPAALCQLDQRARLIERHREGLLDVDVASMLQAATGEGVVTLRRRGNVHDLRRRGRQQLLDLGKGTLDPKAFRQLLRHQQFAIADGDDAAPGDAVNGLNVLIGDLAAADDCDAEHEASLKLAQESGHRSRQIHARLPPQPMTQLGVRKTIALPIGGTAAPIECGRHLPGPFGMCLPQPA